MHLQFSLPVTFLKEKNRFIAYTPALDLSTSGRSYQEAKKRFEEISHIFFEELVAAGTLEDVLTDMGWTKIQKQWHSPVVIGQETEIVQVPA